MAYQPPASMKRSVRNRHRLPEDFRFQLTAEEQRSSRSQIVILKEGKGSTRNTDFQPDRIHLETT
jgi:ORF6N domain-containing protein